MALLALAAFPVAPLAAADDPRDVSLTDSRNVPVAPSAEGAPVTVSPTGDASATFLAVSGTGNASAQVLAVSGTGNASSPAGCWTLGPLGACSGWGDVAVSGTGPASGDFAASAFGDAHARTLAASGTGYAQARYAYSLTGETYGTTSGASLCAMLREAGYGEVACVDPL